jgi:hypothetical protein
MERHRRIRGKFLIRPPELSGKSTTDTSSSEAGYMAKDMLNVASKYLFHTGRVL